MKKIYQIVVDPEQLEKIRKIAQEQERSLSSMIRVVLNDFLKQRAEASG